MRLIGNSEWPGVPPGLRSIFTRPCHAISVRPAARPSIQRDQLRFRGHQNAPSAFFLRNQLLRHHAASTIRTVIVLSLRLPEDDAFLGRNDEFRFARQIGKEVEQLLDVAIERDGGVDDAIIAKGFRRAEIAAADIEMVGFTHAPAVWSNSDLRLGRGIRLDNATFAIGQIGIRLV